jgi:hypothetical protein
MSTNDFSQLSVKVESSIWVLVIFIKIRKADTFKAWITWTDKTWEDGMEKKGNTYNKDAKCRDPTEFQPGT